MYRPINAEANDTHAVGSTGSAGQIGRYRELFDANPLPTWAFDRETLAFLEVNQAAIDHYGYSRSEFLSMTIADIRPREDLPRLLRDIRSAGPISDVATWRHRTKDGRVISVWLRGKDFQFDGIPARLVVAHDVTAQLEAEEDVRRLDAQLQQAQKLEAVGRLVGGMAHDFNNILTAVLAYSSIISTALHPDDPLREDSVEIEKAGRRGADLTRQLLAFSRKQSVTPAVLNLDHLIVNIESMLRRLLGEDIRLSTGSQGVGHVVNADRCQLEQVLLNLAANARDAMPSGGDLAIETAHVEIDGQPYVALRVTDTGCGMDEETRSQIFEPFFTTKEPGRGTGLGLWSAYGIVQRARGRMNVTSELGRGTSFEVLLPAVDSVVPEIPREPTGSAASGPAVVLLVDDDDLVRAAVRRALANSHRVLDAATAEEARALCASHRGTIDLLLTDVVMPGTNGVALAAELGGSRPEMKSLLMSGYVAHPVVRDGMGPQVHFLEKPFAPAELLARVEQVLRGD